MEVCALLALAHRPKILQWCCKCFLWRVLWYNILFGNFLLYSHWVLIVSTVYQCGSGQRVEEYPYE